MHKQKLTDLRTQTRSILILLHKNWVTSKIRSFESIKKKANSKKGVESRADEQGLPPTPWLKSLMSSSHCLHCRVHLFFWLPWTRAHGWCFPCRHQMTPGSTGWRTNTGGLTYMDRGCHMRTEKRIHQHTLRRNLKMQVCRWKRFYDLKVQRRLDWSVCSSAYAEVLVSVLVSGFFFCRLCSLFCSTELQRVFFNVDIFYR